MAYGFVNYFASLCNPAFLFISVAFFRKQLTGCTSSLDYYVSNETDRNRPSYVRKGLFTAYCSVNYRTIWSKTRINCTAGVAHCRSQWITTVRLSMKRAVLARGDSTYRCRSATYGGGGRGGTWAVKEKMLQ